MSPLTYAIQVWGLNVRTSILNKEQQVQNLAACWISDKPRWTRTSELLDSVGWLSIYQLAFYYTFLSLWKIKTHRKPTRNWKAMNRTAGCKGRIEMTDRVWNRLGVRYYDDICPSIKNETKISIFKRKIRKWIKDKIPIHEGIDVG